MKPAPALRNQVKMEIDTCANGQCWTALLLLSFCFPCCAFAAKSHTPVANPIPPAIGIPVGGLGYEPPGDLPAFYFHAMVSVDFIDENRLLFTFEKKGLLTRGKPCPSGKIQRMVHAVVLDLPSGKVETQADWNLYDFDDYLWNLGNGQFLLRQCSDFSLLSADLKLHPFMSASGEIEDVSFSPDRSIVAVEENTAKHPLADNETEVQFVRVHPLGMIARARLPVPGEIPLTGQGILEALSGPHDRWTIDLQTFPGTPHDIVTLQSVCMPRLTALADSMFAVEICANRDRQNFQAYNLAGKLLWKIPIPRNHYDPRFLLSSDGAHFAIESLRATKPLAALDPITRKVVDAEIIDIYDAATGTLIGTLRTMPVYTAGKNADFSPDGSRIAVLHNGAIEICDLRSLAKSN